MITTNLKDAKIFRILGKHSITLPAWQPVNQAAAEACQNCEYEDLASALICKDCPAIDLLKLLKKRVTQKEKVHA